GLLLHELLTGTHPFGTGVATAGEMQRAILEGTPARPSRTARRMDAAAAAARAGTPGKLARQLRGDLDSIVLQAIRREPEPYHAGVFVRRHRVGVAATAVLVAAGILLGALHLDRITRERNLARIEAVKARQVSNLLVSMLESANPEHARGEEITVREVLDRASERIDRDLADQPDILARMQAIIGNVYTSLGEYDKAGAALARARDLQRSRHGPGNPELLESMQAMATLAMKRGENGEAEALMREVLAQRLARTEPDPMLVASARDVLGVALARQGKYDEAETLARAALAVAGDTVGNPLALASARGNLAVLLVRKGELEEAEALYRQALAQRRELQGPAHPDLANLLNNLGVLLSRQERLPEAEPFLREALEMKRKLFGDRHPEV